MTLLQFFHAGIEFLKIGIKTFVDHEFRILGNERPCIDKTLAEPR